MNKYLLRTLAIITAFGAFTMVLLGALVTKTDSGQGCGQTWPLCHGQLLPDSMSVNAFYEYGHRITSGTGGFLIVLLALWAWLSYRKDIHVKILGFLSVFFVVLQGGLGALTVVFEGSFAKYPLLALHFGFALICFASVMLLTVRLFQIEDARRLDLLTASKPATKGLQYTIWALMAYIYLVIYSGALVQHTESALGCGTQFPACSSTYLPGFDSHAGIQMLHRYGAASIWLLLLAFLIIIIRNYGVRRDLVIGSWLAFLLVCLQAVSGAMTVLTGVQLIWGIIHTTLIAFLFVVLSYLCMQIGWPWKLRWQQKKSLVAQDQGQIA
ncbi:COX15/CtaA family protein [Tengunoibacter tsumagoiensis]|uniref:Heme A synthase n=1 Tax=Tengunoibacter tsumagoiensis TaxID=2014871 RepID=A0A402A9S4_9CHLR|nr:heme A synthase [Tengunoibacter tsumagoiensis]GCE15879.1 heme A synthase [Tengunoibacter tsumagoiensis]